MSGAARPPGSLSLLWFDVRHGAPVALRALRRHLGALCALRALLAFLWRDWTRDPYRALRGDPAPDARERFTRRQLRPVLLLDAALGEALGLPPERRRALLAEVVAESGARFVGTQVRHPTPAEWAALDPGARRAFASAVLGRFGNAEATLVDAPGADLAFDVTRCHFVSLCARLGRPEVASLFCAADRVFYDDPRVPIRLERAETLAGGQARCAFRLRFAPGDAAPRALG